MHVADLSRPGSRHPKVIAWRNYWLAPSETFIRDQVEGLTRWEAVRVGRRRFANPLVEPDFAPCSDALTSRVASRFAPSRATRQQIDRLVGDRAVKLVHAHFGTDGLTALPYARRAGKPLLVSFYGMDVTSMPKGRGRAAAGYRRRLPDLFEHAHTLMTVSQFLADELLKLGAPAEKILLNYPGTVVHPPPSTPPARPGVIFVGRLVAKKGVPDLFQAMGMLPEPLRSTPISVVGYGPLLDGLTKQAADLGLAVNFRGRQSSAGISQLLPQHTVFCGPSRRAADGDSEGLGMVFIEAALAGLPVVAYRHGGVPESVQDRYSGLLAPEGDVAALSDALRDLLAEPQRARAMGMAGYHRAAASFELKARTEALEQIYDQIAATVPTRRRPDAPGPTTTRSSQATHAFRLPRGIS